MSFYEIPLLRRWIPGPPIIRKPRDIPERVPADWIEGTIRAVEQATPKQRRRLAVAILGKEAVGEPEKTYPSLDARWIKGPDGKIRTFHSYDGKAFVEFKE